MPCIATTATADAPTRTEILKQLDLAEDDLFVSGFDRPNIRYTVVPKKNVKEQLDRFIRERHSGDAGIVYCLSRKRTEVVARWLAAKGHKAIAYYAGLADALRKANQDRFLNEEGVVVVATVAFGMGIDKPNVRFVAHLDLPKGPEAYYQETGRAGRDGLPADAWMAYSLADVIVLQKMLESSEADRAHRRAERLKLNAIVGFCETASCRRGVLLEYFGECQTGPCGNCDTCQTPVETWDGTVAAQKALSCVSRTGQKFGAGHIVDVLLGKRTLKIYRFKHQSLSTYGIGKDLSSSDWQSVIRQLVASGCLRVDVSGYGSLRLTERAQAVLKGNEKVALRRDPKPDVAARKSDSRPGLADTPELKSLFDSLRDLRLRLARAQKIPPYIIFHDTTLIELARQRPQTLAEMSRIPGIGAVKLERYGEAFLEAVRSGAA